jgi:hypothetical protein
VSKPCPEPVQPSARVKHFSFSQLLWSNFGWVAADFESFERSMPETPTPIHALGAIAAGLGLGWAIDTVVSAGDLTSQRRDEYIENLSQVTQPDCFQTNSYRRRNWISE